jgi:repressor LexA
MVVALVDGSDATVKKFYKERDQIRLEPANPRYKPIIVSPPDRVKIQGVVRGLIRKYKR